ncbi:TIGR04222 domain-containing membrane protein [Kitasatospora sp. NPDC004240]
MWHDWLYLIPGLYLATTIVLTGIARARAFRVPNPMGLPGRGLPLLDAAFLSGGPGRAFDTALVRMHKTGRVIVSRSGLITWTGVEPYDEVEAAIVEAVGPERRRELKAVRRDVMRSAAVQRIGDGLAGRGLMRNPVGLERARKARGLIWLTSPLVALFTVAGFLMGGDRPDLMMAAILFSAPLVAVPSLRVPKSRITPAGRRQLGLMTQGSTAWNPGTGSGVDAGTGLLLGAVALGGLAVGLGDDLELQETMLEAEAELEAQARTAALTTGSPASSSNSSSSSSSCGSTTTWCGGSSDSPSSSSCGGSGCGSSSSCSSSSGSSCSSSSSSCGGSSSSCGGGGGGCGS